MTTEINDRRVFSADNLNQPHEIRTLSDQELEGVAGGFWFVVGFMLISLAPPAAGAIYGATQETGTLRGLRRHN